MVEIYDSVVQAAEAIGANHATLLRWINDAKLSADPINRVRGGGNRGQGWRIKREDLAAAIKGTKPRPR